MSVFVNERLLGSSVAQIDEPTRFDLPLPDGLVGTIANVRVVIQRRSAQGDCRFEPQGYPAQILGTSSVVLAAADARAARLLRSCRALGGRRRYPCPGRRSRPSRSARSPHSAPCLTALVAGGCGHHRSSHSPPGAVPVPAGAFHWLGDASARERGAACAIRPGPRRGDRPSGSHGARPRRILDGAVAQLVMAGDFPGLWIKPLAADGTVAVARPTFISSAAMSPSSTSAGVAMATFDRARHAGADRLSGSGVLVHGGGAVPFLDHRRTLAAGDLAAPVSCCRACCAAVATPPVESRIEPCSRSRQPTARSATFWSRGAS